MAQSNWPELTYTFIEIFDLLFVVHFKLKKNKIHCSITKNLQQRESKIFYESIRQLC